MTMRMIDGGADADANAYVVTDTGTDADADADADANADTDTDADSDADADADVDADTKVNAVVTKCRTELFNRVGNVSRGDVNFHPPHHPEVMAGAQI